MQNMILRKARGESKLLVLPSEHSRVEKMFGRINAARAALVGLDHPDILAIYSVNENKFRLYHMLRDVFPALNEHEIGFSSRGGNILLGPYVAVQRKGSASGERGDDINDIEHGANHLQTKIKTKKLFEEVAPTAEYRLAF